MSTVIHCPDCGGVVGAKTTTEHGPPCTCFVDERSPNDTSIDEAMSQPSTTKMCVKCGKDLSGKKRLKDSHGYWCVECHKADKAEKAPKGIPCPRCSRIVKEETLQTIDGETMCSRCAREKRELKKAGSKKYRALDSTHFEKAEKSKLWILVAVIVVLALFALYGTLHS